MSTDTRKHRVADSYTPPPAKFSDGRIYVFGEVAVLDAPASTPAHEAVEVVEVAEADSTADVDVVTGEGTEEAESLSWFDQAALDQAVIDEDADYELAPQTPDRPVLDVEAMRFRMEQDPPRLHPLTFDELVQGPDVSLGDVAVDDLDEFELAGWSDSDAPAPRSMHSKLATAALVVSISGFVTGVGFLVGYFMARSVLKQMGYTGWYVWNFTTRKRAHAAIVISGWGSALLLVAGVAVLLWWVISTQLPVEIWLPGPDAPVAPVAPGAPLDPATTEAGS
jgi:hypothetical protein